MEGSNTYHDSLDEADGQKGNAFAHHFDGSFQMGFEDEKSALISDDLPRGRNGFYTKFAQ